MAEIIRSRLPRLVWRSAANDGFEKRIGMPMSEPVMIRTAQAGDVSLLHQSLVALAKDTGSALELRSTPDDLLMHGFSDNPAFEALIAEISGQFSGMCICFPSFSTWRGEIGIYVQDLYVAPTFRGQRVGEVLLRAVARHGASKGATHMRLSVDVANSGAQAFYDRLGLAQCHDEQVHMISGSAFRAFAETQQWRP